MRLGKLLLSLGVLPLLAGCVPMMALSAANMVARGAEGAPVSNAGAQDMARELCTQRAAQYGTVNIIDVEQHRVNQIIVWGTAGDGTQKRSFECDFGTKITGFKLRSITPEE